MVLAQLGLGEQLVACIIYCYILFKFLNFYTAIAVLIASFTAAYLYLKHQSEYWKRRGINGPEANLFFGNMLELGKGIDKVDTEWTEKYGKVCGTYLFGKPDLLVSDLEIMRRVMAKDFPNFVNHRRQKPGFNWTDKSDSIVSKVLSILEGDHWKNVRNTITPAFTTGKMKNMVPIFNDALKIFGEVVSKYADNGTSMNMKEVCGAFAMDVIAKSAFGIDIDAQRDRSHPFIKFVNELFSVRLGSPKFIIFLMFPNIVQIMEIMFKFTFFFAEGNEFFKGVLRNVFEERQKNPKKVNPDFLQLLLNASAEQGEKTDVDKEIAHDEVTSGKRIQLTELEMMSQSFIFIFAGYETTATTLHFALYLLAMHPEIQDKVADEVKRVVGDGDIMYDHIARLTYMEQVISETLRMFPPAARLDRRCAKDIDIEGYTIPKDCVVSVPVWVIHHDPEIYPEPEKFDPDRFSAEEKANRDPLAYIPFGYGPRNCIGMRFAQLELRMALAYLIKEFKFVPCEQTEKMPIKLDMTGLTKTASPIFLGVEKRTK